MVQAPVARILVVEDDPALARVYVRALVAVGYQVDHAQDGVEGLERLLRGSYDAVLSDVCMPRLTGLDLLEQVVRMSKDIPVVLMTAQLDADMYAKAREMGTVRYLLKPVRMEQLARAVESAVALGAARLRAKNRKLTPRA